MNVCRVLYRFELQAAALWPSSEVGGQTGSTGAVGNEVQGNRHEKKKIIDHKSPDTSVNVPLLAGQQHAGWLALGERLPQRGEAGHR